MTRRLWQLGLLVGLIACSRSSEPLRNKNTNWLHECRTADDCSAEQSCLCGLCTAVCGAASECGGEGVAASCLAVSDRRVAEQCAANERGDAVAICVAACADDTACEGIGPGLACREEVCVQSEFSVIDAGSDASVPGLEAGLRDAAVDATVGVVDAGGSELVDAMADAAPAVVEDAGADASNPLACAPCAEGWSCIAGVCAQILADDQPGLVAMALDAERVYWVNYGSYDRLGNYQHDGSIVAMPLAGGDIVTLAAGRERPAELRVDDGYAYWIDNAQPDTGESATIMRVVLSGGTPEPIMAALLTSPAIAVDGAYVYFISQTISSARPWVRRVLKDGSAEPEDLFERTSAVNGGVHSMRVEEETLYWSGEVADVFIAPKDGSAGPSALSSPGGGAPALFAVESGTVYYTGLAEDELGLYVGRPEQETLRLAYAEAGLGANAKRVASGVAVDSAFVYWAWTDSLDGAWTGGTLVRSEKTPGDTEILLSSELLADALVALEGAYIYLGVRYLPGESRGTVIRIEKP